MKIKLPLLPIITNLLMNNMAYELMTLELMTLQLQSGNSSGRVFTTISKVLPQGITWEFLYKINDQSVLFLIWILKKERFWSDLIKEVLEEPFTVMRTCWRNSRLVQLGTMKKKRAHGIFRGWYGNGQLCVESHWKDRLQNGMTRGWKGNGQLTWEEIWMNGTRYINREFDENGNPFRN